MTYISSFLKPDIGNPVKQMRQKNYTYSFLFIVETGLNQSEHLGLSVNFKGKLETDVSVSEMKTTCEATAVKP